MESTSGASGYQSPFQHSLLNLPAADLEGIFLILFFVILGAWLLYTVVVAYHWFRYSHRSWLAVPAVATHVIVSGLIMVYIATGI
jgi:hypothetical protein